MARERNPDRDKAFEFFREHNGKITNREIAKILNIPEKTVSVWKIRDKWKERLMGERSTSNDKRSTTCDEKTTKRKHGGQPNNKNAVGHGAPLQNKNAETHGFFTKFLPEETFEIMQAIQEKDPLDIIWENIMIQYTAIVRAQKIMYVFSRDDVTVTKVGYTDGNVSGERWEVQQAWDKQSNFLKAQSRAMGELRSLIKQYDELLKSGLATEEQKLRITKLKVDIDILKGGGQGNDQEGIDNFIKATTMLDSEVAALFDDSEGDSNGSEDIQEEEN